MKTCRGCGAEIEWARTKSGKAIPLDPGNVERGNITVESGVATIVPFPTGNRISHFATCPHAASLRRGP